MEMPTYNLRSGKKRGNYEKTVFFWKKGGKRVDFDRIYGYI